MANFSPFSLFFLAIFAAVLSHCADGINPICKNTHHIDLCDRIVKGATNALDATINAIGAATNTSKDNQKKLIPLIEKETGKLPPPERDALVKACTVDFQDAIGELISGCVFIGRGDSHAAVSFLNGARSSANHCRNAVSQKVFLATSILIILISNAANGAPAGGAAVSFCSTTDAGEEQALCTKLVNGASTWDQALSNVVNAIGAEAKKDKPMFDSMPKRLPTDLKPVTKDSILSTCKEAYESVSDNVDQVLGNIKSGDPMGSIDTELSATLSALSDCTDGMNEFGVNDPEVAKARDLVQKYASISLAVSSLKKNT